MLALRLALATLILRYAYLPGHPFQFFVALLLLVAYGYVEFTRGYNAAITEFDEGDQEDREDAPEEP